MVTMYGMKGDLRSLLLIMISEMALGYSIQHIFSDEITSALTLVINTLACVISPLDTLDKVLRTKDLNYVSYSMHTLGVVNGIIWTLYHFLNQAYPLAIANSLGVLCEIFLLFGCLYGTGFFSSGHPLVALSYLFVNSFFNKPKELI